MEFGRCNLTTYIMKKGAEPSGQTMQLQRFQKRKMPRKRTGIINGFAERLDTLINKSGLTCSQIGEKVGRDRKTIYAYKNGDCSPDVVTLARLCAVLHTTPNYLIYGKD